MEKEDKRVERWRMELKKKEEKIIEMKVQPKKKDRKKG